MRRIGIAELNNGSIYKAIKEGLPIEVTRRSKTLLYMIESISGCNHKCMGGCGRQGLSVYMTHRVTGEKSKANLCLEHLREYHKEFDTKDC